MMDFLAREALMSEFYAAVWPENDGEPIAVEWLSFMPGAPIFAMVPGEYPPKMRMLVEYGDG